MKKGKGIDRVALYRARAKAAREKAAEASDLSQQSLIDIAVSWERIAESLEVERTSDMLKLFHRRHERHPPSPG